MKVFLYAFVMLLFSFPIIFVISSAFIVNGDEDDLLSVVVVYRHGDRTPTSFYPNDPYKGNEYFPQGTGQLTNQGKQRQFELGQWYRNRYANFLPDQYSVEDIKIYSTDVDRALMSAASNLAGLYPPKSNQIWNDNLDWQPIPIHTAPVSILSELYFCAKYDILYAELLFSEPFQQLDNENRELYNYLANYTGSMVATFWQAESIGDTLFVEDHNNLTLPDWTKDVYPDKLRPLTNAFFSTFSYNDDLTKLSAGPFLYNVIKHFNKVVSNMTAEKFLMYSGHDINLATILTGLGDFEPHQPYFASTVMFELRRKNGEYFVNVFYKNDTEVRPVQIRDCGTDCTLSAFESNLSNFTLSTFDWVTECYLPSWKLTKSLLRRLRLR